MQLFYSCNIDKVESTGIPLPITDYEITYTKTKNGRTSWTDNQGGSNDGSIDIIKRKGVIIMCQII